MKYLMQLRHAQDAFQDGSILNWIAEYLENEGHNPELLKYIKDQPDANMDLRLADLRTLKRVCGPEEGMMWQETAETWHQHLDELKRAVQNGYELPPLIVTDFWYDAHIADGAHRRDALMELGIEKYWTIFITKKSINKTLKDFHQSKD